MRIQQQQLTHLVPAIAAVGMLGFAHQSHAVQVNLLDNPSFEADDASGGDIPVPTGWFGFDNNFATQGVPARTGDQTLKLFGPFFPGGGAGVGQAFPASPGESWEATAWGRNDSADAIGDTNFAVVQVQFLDGQSNVLSSTDSTTQINANSTPDTWLELSAQSTAPAGTTTAQIIIVHVQLDPVSGGAVFFDDAVFGLADLGLAGDTDGDGDVDDSDLGTAFSNYTGPLDPGTGGKVLSQGDTDGDGDVDDSDLGTAFSNYTGPLSAAVPEPTSLALLGLGGLIAARRRRSA